MHDRNHVRGEEGEQDLNGPSILTAAQIANAEHTWGRLLTRRENELVILFCEQGLSTKQVSDKMGITLETLKVYLSARVYPKLGIHNKFALMHWYWKKRISAYERP